MLAGAGELAHRHLSPHPPAAQQLRPLAREDRRMLPVRPGGDHRRSAAGAWLPVRQRRGVAPERRCRPRARVHRLLVLLQLHLRKSARPLLWLPGRSRHCQPLRPGCAGGIPFCPRDAARRIDRPAPAAHHLDGRPGAGRPGARSHRPAVPAGGHQGPAPADHPHRRNCSPSIHPSGCRFPPTSTIRWQASRTRRRGGAAVSRPAPSRWKTSVPLSATTTRS